jgi:soluble lytic murein transglycosylase-like protein
MIGVLVICFSFITTKEVCDVNKQIIKNKPSISRTYAYMLSETIVKISKNYEISPRKYAAILMQESAYKLNAVNKTSKDYGIAQINHKTALAFSLNVDRLLTDLVYSLEAGAIILSDFKKRHYKKEKEFYFTRYNTSNKQKRINYQKLVQRYYEDFMVKL